MDERLSILVKEIAINSNQSAFNDFFHHYFQGLFSYVKSIIRDQEVAEEIVSDVFYKVWVNRSGLPFIRNLTQYLYTSAKNTCVNYFHSKDYSHKKRNVHLENIGECYSTYLAPADGMLISAETLSQINTAINGLPPRCRLTFRLIKDENLKYAEVAELLGISVKGVEKQMAMAFKQLSVLLEHDLHDYITYLRKQQHKKNPAGG